MASGPPFPPPYDPPPAPYGAASPSRESEYQWLAPASLPPQPGMPPGLQPHDPGSSARLPMYELRPLSTGEVLDRTFSLYRSRFLMFAGIASLSAAVQLVGQAVQLVVQHFLMRRGHVLTLQITNGLLSIAVSAVFLLAFAVTQAATVWAMGEVYLGRSTTVTAALRSTVRGWLRYLGIALWQMGSLLWLPAAIALSFAGIWLANGRSLGGFGVIALVVLLLLAAFIGGFILYLRNLLAVPITVRENLGVRACMRRSKALASGGKGKLFLVLLIAVALYMVMAMLMGVAVAITMFLHRGANMLENLLPVQIVTLIIGFAGYTLISPVVMIGTAMVYFDQRVRKEAFDVAVLLGDESASLPGAPMVAAAPAYAASDYATPLYSAATATPPPLEAPRMSEAPAAVAAIHSAESPLVESSFQEPASQEPSHQDMQGGASGL